MKFDQDNIPAIDQVTFTNLVDTLYAIDLLKHDESLVPYSNWSVEAILKYMKQGAPQVCQTYEENILEYIQKGADQLPLAYQQKFVEPLVKNLRSVIVRSGARRHSLESETEIANAFRRTLEILGGAVYCHDAGTVSTDVVRALHCFMAVVSNTYRSFVPSKRKHLERVPAPTKEFYPPLATFRNGEVSPYMMTSDVVEKATGGSVGVVVLPARYKSHPVLWTAIAHEVGGHEMMNALPELLPELQRGVRLLFNVRSLRSGDSMKNIEKEQLMGLLWQYWTEETVADVCGVLNIGPAYGIALAVYQAALVRGFADKYAAPNNTPLRLWSGVQPGFAEGLNENTTLPELDSHAVDILKLHVIIGVVENLNWLSRASREEYVRLLQGLSKICATDKKGIHKGNINICGLVQAGPDLWIKVNTYNTAPLPLDEMQSAARRVGAYMATASLSALGGHSLQQLESWDETDEETSQAVKRMLVKGGSVSEMGDDGQLLAGGTLAFAMDPKKYTEQATILMNALEDSFARDYYWGISRLHFLLDYGSRPASEGAVEGEVPQPQPGLVSPSGRLRVLGPDEVDETNGHD